MSLVSRQSWQMAAAIFALLFAVYLLTYSGRIHVVDEAYILAASESLMKGRLDVNQLAARQWDIPNPRDQIGTPGPSGDIYGKKGIGVSLAALPLFSLGAALPGVGAVHVALLTGAAIAALTGSLLFLFLRELGFPPLAALAGALIYGLGTPAWPYARMLFAEPLAGLGLLMALMSVSQFRRAPAFRAAFLCGLGMGVAVAAVPIAVILAPLYGLALLLTHWRRALPGMAAGLAAPAAIVAWYNTARFGSPFDTGYLHTFQDFAYPLPLGVAGLLVSPARGLFVYAPVMLLLIPGFLIAWRARARRFEAGFVAAITGVFLAFYGALATWWAGVVWGPRYLVPILPLMMLPVAETWARFSRGRWRALALALAGLSVLVQVVGVAANFVDAEMELARAFGLQDTPWYFVDDAAFFNVARSPLLFQAQNALEGLLDVSWAASGAIDALALGAGLLALGMGAVALWAAHRGSPRFREVVWAAEATALLASLVIVTRATSTPFYGTEADGRDESLAHVLEAQAPGDALISAVPYLYEFMMDRYSHLPPVIGLPRDQRLDETSLALLERAVASHPRLWFHSMWTSPGDPANYTEHWLARHDFPLQKWTFGGYRLTLFSAPAEPPRTQEVRAIFDDAFRLEQVTTAWRQVEGESVLQMDLQWAALRAPGADYQVFLHVYDAEGNRVAQADHTPVGGFAPTSTWQPGDRVHDRAAVALPAGSEAYRVALGLYDWRTGARLPVELGSGGDPAPDATIWLDVSPGDL